MIPSLEGWPTKAKEAPSPHEVKLTLLDTNPVFLCLRELIRIPKTGFQPFTKHRILRTEFFFCMPYGIFILKKLPTLETCYFKVAGAIDPEPKGME